MRTLFAILLLAGSCFGQLWSGVLASSRAIDWTTSGLPATLPDGETTANPWTPPTGRTLCNTLNSTHDSTDRTAALIAAFAACSPKTYLLLGSGPFYISGDAYIANNNVTLRGSGVMSTQLVITGGSGQLEIGYANGAGSANVTSGSTFTKGSTSLILDSGASSLSVGTVISIKQCNTGLSGSGCATGTVADNGSIFVCNGTLVCSGNTGTEGPSNAQQQQVYVTNVVNNGNSTYTVTFTPGLEMPNWSYSSTPTANWQNTVASPIGIGLESMTVDETGSSIGAPITLHGFSYASWIKNVRFIGRGLFYSLYVAGTLQTLITNSYFFTQSPSAPSTVDSIILEDIGNTSGLYVNNIFTGGYPIEGLGSNVGMVYAYNFGNFGTTAYYENVMDQHVVGSSMLLLEGNQLGNIEDEDIWGTHNLNTFFRNNLSCADPPYIVTDHPRGIHWGNYARFENAIGNAIGSSFCTSYQGTSATDGAVWQIDTGDSLVATTGMRWANVSNITQVSDTPTNSGKRCVSSEVPSSLSSPNTAYQNPVPTSLTACGGSATLVPSFFMSTAPSWFKVCKTWTSFPSSCNTMQTQPFPVAGPDVSGGSYIGGYAYDNPAAVAEANLPIDTSYQNSYSVSSSSWSSGTETLYISGLPTTTHLNGRFQLTGVPACNTGGSNPSEFVITGCLGTNCTLGTGAPTAVQYALAADPGSCAGATMKWPDVRQFDEAVYNASGSGGSTPDSIGPGMRVSGGTVITELKDNVKVGR